MFTSSDRTRQQTALCEHLESKENYGHSAGQGHGSSERQAVILRTEVKGEPQKGDMEQSLEGLFRFETWNAKFANHFFIEALFVFISSMGRPTWLLLLKKSPPRKGYYFTYFCIPKISGTLSCLFLKGFCFVLFFFPVLQFRKVPCSFTVCRV